MASLCIGADVGGTNLRLALVAPDGEVLRRIAEPTEGSSGYAAFLARLLSAVHRLRMEAAEMGREVGAVGVGIPGLVSGEGVIRSSLNLAALEGVNLAAELPAAIGLPVAVLNDANACAIGEMLFGAGRGYRSWLMVTIGTGIGAALVLDGKLWPGADGLAGELGHLTVDPGGRPCGCGNRGCLEQYASASAICRGEDGEALFTRARKGDPEAWSRFEEAGSYLGIAAASVMNLLNLEAIVLGGGGAAGFELIAPAMRREMLARTLSLVGGRVTIERGMLNGDAGVLGAAATAFDLLGRSLAPQLS